MTAKPHESHWGVRLVAVILLCLSLSWCHCSFGVEPLEAAIRLATNENRSRVSAAFTVCFTSRLTCSAEGGKVFSKTAGMA